MSKKNIPLKVQRKMFENNLSLLSAAIERYSSNKNVLGIDPSLSDTAVGVSRIGWSKMLVFDSPDIIRTKAKEYSPCQRIAFTREYLVNLIKKYPTQLVTIEGYAYGREQNRELMGEVGGMIRLDIFYDNPNEIGPVVIVGPTQLKKYILKTAQVAGGKQTKQLIIKEVYKQFNVDSSNDNQADALVLCAIARDIVKFTSLFKDRKFSDDKDIRDFIASGWKDTEFKKYQWEVICQLIINKCDKNNLLAFHSS